MTTVTCDVCGGEMEAGKDPCVHAAAVFTLAREPFPIRGGYWIELSTGTFRLSVCRGCLLAGLRQALEEAEG